MTPKPTVIADQATPTRARRQKVYLLAVNAVLLIAIGAFALVSFAIHDQPSTEPFRGWVALLQQGRPLDAVNHEVQLRVDAMEKGAPGERPRLRYTAVVCGERPFNGVLLIGGDARLDHVSTLGPTAATEVDINEIDALALGLPDQPLNIGPAQAVHLRIDKPPRCLSAEAAGTPLATTGTFVAIGGRAAAPIQRASKWLLWEGPRTSQAWPLVGAIRDFPSGMLGEFEAVKGLSGSWYLPGRRRHVINGGGLTADTTVEVARPEPTGLTSMTWDSIEPLEPAAVTTDRHAMSVWQTWLVVTSIFFGISTSLLASRILDWARRRHTAGSDADDRNEPLHTTPEQPRVSHPTHRNRDRDDKRGWITTAVLLTLATAVIAAITNKRPRT